MPTYHPNIKWLNDLIAPAFDAVAAGNVEEVTAQLTGKFYKTASALFPELHAKYLTLVKQQHPVVYKQLLPITFCYTPIATRGAQTLQALLKNSTIEDQEIETALAELDKDIKSYYARTYTEVSAGMGIGGTFYGDPDSPIFIKDQETLDHILNSLWASYLAECPSEIKEQWVAIQTYRKEKKWPALLNSFKELQQKLDTEIYEKITDPVDQRKTELNNELTALGYNDTFNHIEILKRYLQNVKDAPDKIEVLTLEFLKTDSYNNLFHHAVQNPTTVFNRLIEQYPSFLLSQNTKFHTPIRLAFSEYYKPEVTTAIIEKLKKLEEASSLLSKDEYFAGLGHNQQLYRFKKKAIDSNNKNSGFEGLGITRQTLVDTLLSLKSDAEAYQLLAAEILECLERGEWQPTEAQTWKEQLANPNTASEIQPIVFEAYVNSYLNEERSLGMATILLYAQIKKFSVCIWQGMASEFKMRAEHYQMPLDEEISASKVVHLYWNQDGSYHPLSLYHMVDDLQSDLTYRILSIDAVIAKEHALLKLRPQLLEIEEFWTGVMDSWREMQNDIRLQREKLKRELLLKELKFSKDNTKEQIELWQAVLTSQIDFLEFFENYLQEFSSKQSNYRPETLSAFFVNKWREEDTFVTQNLYEQGQQKVNYFIGLDNAKNYLLFLREQKKKTESNKEKGLLSPNYEQKFEISLVLQTIKKELPDLKSESEEEKLITVLIEQNYPKQIQRYQEQYAKLIAIKEDEKLKEELNRQIINVTEDIKKLEESKGSLDLRHSKYKKWHNLVNQTVSETKSAIEKLQEIKSQSTLLKKLITPPTFSPNIVVNKAYDISLIEAKEPPNLEELNKRYFSDKNAKENCDIPLLIKELKADKTWTIWLYGYRGSKQPVLTMLTSELPIYTKLKFSSSLTKLTANEVPAEIYNDITTHNAHNEKNTLLHLEVLSGKIDSASLLLRSCVNEFSFNQHDQSAFSLAVLSNNKEMVKVFFDYWKNEPLLFDIEPIKKEMGYLKDLFSMIHNYGEEKFHKNLANFSKSSDKFELQRICNYWLLLFQRLKQAIDKADPDLFIKDLERINNEIKDKGKKYYCTDLLEKLFAWMHKNKDQLLQLRGEDFKQRWQKASDDYQERSIKEGNIILHVTQENLKLEEKKNKEIAQLLVAKDHQLQQVLTENTIIKKDLVAKDKEIKTLKGTVESLQSQLNSFENRFKELEERLMRTSRISNAETPKGRSSQEFYGSRSRQGSNANLSQGGVESPQKRN